MELTQEEKDALWAKDIVDRREESRRSFDEAVRHNGQVEAFMRSQLAMQNVHAEQLPTLRQEHFRELYRMMLDTRRAGVTSTTTDALLADIAKDALLMALAVKDEYLATIDSLRGL